MTEKASVPGPFPPYRLHRDISRPPTPTFSTTTAYPWCETGDISHNGGSRISEVPELYPFPPSDKREAYLGEFRTSPWNYLFLLLPVKGRLVPSRVVPDTSVSFALKVGLGGLSIHVDIKRDSIFLTHRVLRNFPRLFSS